MDLQTHSSYVKFLIPVFKIQSDLFKIVLVSHPTQSFSSPFSLEKGMGGMWLSNTFLPSSLRSFAPSLWGISEKEETEKGK